MRWMSSILTRFGSTGRIEVAHFAFGHLQRHRLAGQLVVGQQPIDGAFEVAAVMGHRLRDEGEHRSRNFEAGMMGAGGGNPALEDFEPQLLAERADLDHEAAGKPRADAIVETFEV